VEGEDLLTEVDEVCGLEQPGRIFFRSAEDQRVSREAIEGTKLFRKYLRKAGWRYAKSDRLDKAYVFLAKGFDAKTAEEGVSKFYGYDEIYRKWKSDPDFRRLYGGSDDEDTESEIEAVAPPSSPSNIVFGSGTGENQSADYNWLGQPTPGIPVAARRPDESAAERETIEEPGPATPCRQPKRGYPTEESKKQGNKRPKKKKSSSNTSRLAKSRPATGVFRQHLERRPKPKQVPVHPMFYSARRTLQLSLQQVTASKELNIFPITRQRDPIIMIILMSCVSLTQMKPSSN